MVPPWASTSRLLIASPSPVPAGLVVTKGVNSVRALRGASHRERLRLAGLVAAVENSSLVLLDEYGTADVDVTPGVALPAEGELVLADGVVEVKHGAALLKAPRVEAWHAGLGVGGKAAEREAA